MHGSIRDRLEDLLSAEGSAARDPGLVSHLSSCNECSSELAAIKQQAELLSSLRAPAEVEPGAGFYARVMQRIEERAKDSIWTAFIYSPFAKRLTYVSLAATLLLGSYAISREVRSGGGSNEQAVVQYHDDPLVTGSLQQQRDAVLDNFATHEGQLQ